MHTAPANTVVTSWYCRYLKIEMYLTVKQKDVINFGEIVQNVHGP